MAAQESVTLRFWNFSVSKLLSFETSRFWNFSVSKLLGFETFPFFWWNRFWKILKLIEVLVSKQFGSGVSCFGLFLSILDPKCWTWLESYGSRHFNNDIIQSTNFELKSFNSVSKLVHVFWWYRLKKIWYQKKYRYWFQKNLVSKKDR